MISAPEIASSDTKHRVGTARRLALGSALNVVNLASTALLSLLIMPFVVHMLGDRMYGIWVLVVAITGYYALGNLGLSVAVSRHLAAALGAGDEEECNRVFNTAFSIFCAIGLLVIIVSGVVVALTPLFCKNPQDVSLLRKTILILGFNVALAFPMRVFTGTLGARLRFDLLGGLGLLSAGLRTVLIIAFVHLGRGVVGLAWATLLSQIPSSLLYVHFARKSLPFLRLASEYRQRGTARKLFSYGIFSFIAHIGETLRFKVDAPVVAAFVGLAAVTHYKIAGTLAQYFMELITVVMGVLGPVFSRLDGAGDYQEIKKTFFFSSKLSVCAASFVGFALIAWGKPFIERWMGPQYLDAYPCLVALTSGLIVALTQAPSVNLLFGISRHRFFALFHSIEGVSNLIFSLLLVKKYGMLGVAVGTLIPMVIIKLFIQPVYVCRVANIVYLDYLRKMGRTLAVVAGSLVIPVIFTAKFATSNYGALFAVGAASAICYVLPVWLFAFSAGETQILRRALAPRLA